MTIPLKSIINFTSFENCVVQDKQIPEVKQKHFLCFHWKVKLIAVVNNKGKIELAYFSRIELLIRRILPSLFFKLITNKEKIWKVLQSKKVVQDDETLPKDKKSIRDALGQKIAVLIAKKRTPQSEPNNPEVAPTPQPQQTTPVGQNVLEKVSAVDQFINCLNQGSEVSKEILEAIPDLNAPLSRTVKQTPLTLAVDKDRGSVVENLLLLKDESGQKKVNVNQCNGLGKSPLAVAVETDKNKPLIQLLLGAGAKPADKSEYTKLRQKAEDHEKTYLVEILDQFLPELNQAGKGKKASASDIDPAIITKLADYLEQGIEVEEVKRNLLSISNLNKPLSEKVKHSPLTLAIEKNDGNFEIVEYLLSLKDESEQKKVDANQCDGFGNSPLSVAIKSDRNKRFIKMLMDAGAKPKHEVEYKELRKIAAGQGKDFLVEILDNTQK